MISQRPIVWLVVLGLVLPVAGGVIVAVGLLLAAMGDVDGAQTCRIAAWVVGIVWLIDLVVLLLALGIRATGIGPGRSADEER